MTSRHIGYPLAQGSNAGAGSDADLHTDVMRFMAILSLCLVAIFALVQSVPVNQIPEPETVVQENAVVVERVVDVPLIQMPRPKPAPENMKERAERAAPVATAIPEPPQAGFTLRFESDGALEALVARGEIGLFALSGSHAGSNPERPAAVRLSIEQGRMAFWPSSMPDRYHEMDPDTVPLDVKRALRYSAGRGDLVWAVTLPAKLSMQLQGLTDDTTAGALVIDASGKVRLEPTA